MGKYFLVLLYENYSNTRMENDMIKKVLEKLNLKLPDEFLKKWLKVVDKEKGTSHEIEGSEYSHWSESMKWHLIQDKIIAENNLKPSMDDLKDDVKNSLKNILPNINKDEDDEHLKHYAEHYLSDHKHKHTIEDKLINERTVKYLKSKFKIQEKEVYIDEFTKM